MTKLMRGQRRHLVLFALIALLVSVVGGYAAGQRVGNPSGPFTLRLPSASVELGSEILSWPTVPECADGVNNDEDIVGGAPQDTAIDFAGGDAQCVSAEDASEVQGGLQANTPVTFTGTIAGDGTWSVETSAATFPVRYLFARFPISGPTVATITASATHAAAGNLNPLNGVATIRLRLAIDFDGTPFGSDCSVGTTGNPIDINVLSTSLGTPYDADQGTLTLGNSTYAVPGASGCSTFPVNMNNELNNAMGIPAASGQNAASFAGAFDPVGSGPSRAISASMIATGAPACRAVTFDGSASTSVRPVASYGFDDTNNGSFEQTGASTSRSVTFATPGTRTARMRVTDDQGDFHESLRTYTVTTNLSPTTSLQPDPVPLVPPGGNVDITLTANDPEGGATTITVSDQPDHGTLVGTEGSQRYTADADYEGPDAFTFQIADDCGNTVTRTVQLDVGFPPVQLTVAPGGTCGPGVTEGTIELSVTGGSAPVSLSAFSSSQEVVGDEDITLDGTGSDHTMTVVARKGRAVITIDATDGVDTTSVEINVRGGNKRDEFIKGSDGTDMLFGAKGNDTLKAQAGNDLMCEGPGRGKLVGGPGGDMFGGGSGVDKAPDFNAGEGDQQDGTIP